ncbi:MAG: hypothetical protein ACK4GN_16545 [Runella sp.]
MKLFKYLSLIVFSVLWVGSCHPDLRHLAYDWGWYADDYRYGDLYRLSSLSKFKEPTAVCTKLYKDSLKNNTALYLIGDSFTEPARINSDDFVAARYERVHWAESLVVELDTHRRNVLILQTVERSFRQHFEQPVRQIKFEKPNSNTIEKTISKSWSKILEESEEAITSVLFSNDFFLKIKEWKADFNLHYFARHNDQVALSPDGRHILFCWDTDSTRLTSCFYPLPQAELDQLIKVANQTRAFYLSKGFDEVYLSIIPNKTSIVAPNMGQYNHLVERVQQHPQLQLPTIDVWKYFTENAQSVYSKSDTHWNCHGQNYWVKQINKVLK